jgi:uncharacterized protein
MYDAQLLMVPGYTGSGGGHWQSLWQQAESSIGRVEQDDWNRPEPAAWSQAIEAAVRRARRPAILVAHSCGAIGVAHWAARFQTPIAGAFLVAPPDPARDDLDAPIRNFGMPDVLPLPFPALVVASDDDPYCDAHRAAEFAAGWRAGLVRAGAVGHLNTASGHGPWPEGRQWLDAFLARVVGEAGGARAGQSI